MNKWGSITFREIPSTPVGGRNHFRCVNQPSRPARTTGRHTVPILVLQNIPTVHKLLIRFFYRYLFSSCTWYICVTTINEPVEVNPGDSITTLSKTLWEKPRQMYPYPENVYKTAKNYSKLCLFRLVVTAHKDEQYPVYWISCHSSVNITFHLLWNFNPST